MNFKNTISYKEAPGFLRKMVDSRFEGQDEMSLAMLPKTNNGSCQKDTGNDIKSLPLA